MKRALITGITGQDGLYLSELLLSKGYEVYGLIRGQNNPKADLVRRVVPDVKLLNGDITDLASLLRAFGEAISPAPSDAASPLVEPLSAREHEVLRLLARGRTNQEIAGELSVAATTAKKHISNLIGKLGARNRTEAVARARALRLL